MRTSQPLVLEETSPAVTNAGELVASRTRFLGRYRRSSLVDGRHIVVVLGMHRSGTSLISNVLHLLGVDMVRTAVHSSPSNPTGFWEREEITAIQDEILSVIERPIAKPSHVLPFPTGWWRDLRLKDPKVRLRELVREELEEVSGPWGFKDPRTCRLLPLWAEIFDELGVVPRFVWSLRSPSEAAQSMMLKNPKKRPLTLPQSELMWLGYNYDVARYVAPHQPTIVRYDEWFEDPVGAAERLAADLEILWRGTRDDLADMLSALVNSEFRHHQRSDRQKTTLPISAAFYDSLLAFCAGDGAKQLDVLMGNVRSLFATLQPYLEMADQVGPLSEENGRLQLESRQLGEQLEAAGATLVRLQDEWVKADQEKERALEQAANRLKESEAREAGLDLQLAEVRSEADAVALHLAAVERLQDEWAKADREKERALEQAADRLKESEAREAGLDLQLVEVRSEADAVALHLAAVNAELKSIVSKLEIAEADGSAATDKVQLLEGSVSELKSELHSLKQALSAAEEDKVKLTSKLLAAREEASAKEARDAEAAEGLNGKILALHGEAAGLREERAALATDLQETRSRLQLAESGCSSANERADQLEKELREAEANREAASARVMQLEAHRQEVEEALAAAAAALREAHLEGDRVQSERDRLRQELVSSEERSFSLKVQLDAAGAEICRLEKQAEDVRLNGSQELEVLRREMQIASDSYLSRINHLNSKLASVAGSN